MSAPTQNVGTTLTGGIQDISALLPLLGTDQCEQHVGSALDGGYLYAAAAPLSIFGCLGIVKVGISILISSISISIPKVSISLHPFTMRFSQEQWLGARTLNNAGFKPVGTVAPLIAMEGGRYKAEMRLMEILQEKNIDNPENLSIEWESRKWNVSLVLFTILAAAVSGTPYIALLLQNSQPLLVHSPWIFPLLRTVGSCLATVCCQFLVQSRIISLMKNRIVFMVMNRVLIDDLSKHKKVEMDRWFKQCLRWDVDLPAEQCLWSLKRFLSQPHTQSMNGADKPEDPSHVSIAMPTLSFSSPEDISRQLQELHVKHFLTPTVDYAFMLISWIILCLSLPATVAGYIGCFTLVSDSPGNGPIFWLGLEAALSIVRILVWAWNPSWDEKTDVTVKLELTKDPPLVTTEKYAEVMKLTGDRTLALVPERRFLERITPYTGPLEQFRTSGSLVLYFTLTSTWNRNNNSCLLLYMTVFDFNKRLAVTILRLEGGLEYFDATVSCNHISSEMETKLQSWWGNRGHPWATNDATLFEALAEYYKSIMHALKRSHLHSRAPANSQLDLDKHGDSHTVITATLPWTWSLLPKKKQLDNQSPDWQVLGSPTERDQLYLGRGYEHHLKTVLIEYWSRWIVSDLHALQTDSRNDCHHALADVASDEAKWELTELDMQLPWEWTRRELVLVLSSAKIEDVLKRRMDKCIDKITKARGNASGWLREWMLSEFRIGQRKRLEKERGQAKERVEKAMKDASEHAESESRPWSLENKYSPRTQWEEALQLIDEQWSAAIHHSQAALENVVNELCKGVGMAYSYFDTTKEKPRDTIVKQLRQRFVHWTHPQRENERSEMYATIVRISQSEGEHLYHAYQYPDPHEQATARFVTLKYLESQWKVCAATVYDVEDCREDHIRDVINQSTTRSVINVPPALIESIPENDHLLYIGFSGNGGKEPAFIQRNRDRWWDRLEQWVWGNSSTFYFSPEGLSRDSDGASIASYISTIAHIFIFLKTPSRLRLRLLHRQDGDTSVFIQEKGKKLHHITREIPDNNPKHFRLQDFELDQFEPGRHELEVVVMSSFYVLRDILIEFFNDSPSDSSLDNTGSNLATKVQHGDGDTGAGSSGTGEIAAEEDRNANSLPPAVKNDIPS